MRNQMKYLSVFFVLSLIPQLSLAATKNVIASNRNDAFEGSVYRENGKIFVKTAEGREFDQEIAANRDTAFEKDNYLGTDGNVYQKTPGYSQEEDVLASSAEKIDNTNPTENSAKSANAKPAIEADTGKVQTDSAKDLADHAALQFKSCMTEGENSLKYLKDAEKVRKSASEVLNKLPKENSHVNQVRKEISEIKKEIEQKEKFIKKHIAECKAQVKDSVSLAKSSGDASKAFKSLKSGEKAGMSTAAKVGIGIGAAALVGGGAFLLMGGKKDKKENNAGSGGGGGNAAPQGANNDNDGFSAATVENMQNTNFVCRKVGTANQVCDNVANCECKQKPAAQLASASTSDSSDSQVSDPSSQVSASPTPSPTPTSDAQLQTASVESSSDESTGRNLASPAAKLRAKRLREQLQREAR